MNTLDNSYQYYVLFAGINCFIIYLFYHIYISSPWIVLTDEIVLNVQNQYRAKYTAEDN